MPLAEATFSLRVSGKKTHSQTSGDPLLIMRCFMRPIAISGKCAMRRQGGDRVKQSYSVDNPLAMAGVSAAFTGEGVAISGSVKML